MLTFKRTLDVSVNGRWHVALQTHVYISDMYIVLVKLISFVCTINKPFCIFHYIETQCTASSLATTEECASVRAAGIRQQACCLSSTAFVGCKCSFNLTLRLFASYKYSLTDMKYLELIQILVSRSKKLANTDNFFDPSDEVSKYF